MLFKKRRAVVCAVCGKFIAHSEPRIVDKNRATKTERHTHMNCSPIGRHPQPPSPQST